MISLSTINNHSCLCRLNIYVHKYSMCQLGKQRVVVTPNNYALDHLLANHGSFVHSININLLYISPPLSSTPPSYYYCVFIIIGVLINTGQTRARIKEWKDAASNSDDNSHPFTTKPRSTNTRRATDKWKLSHHESVEAVKLIAPDAEEVTADDRAVSASYREGEAQRSKESQKRKP